MDAVILAGGKSNKELFEETKATCKAFISLNNRPMMEYVIGAFLDSDKIGKLFVFVNEDAEFTHCNQRVKVIKSNEHPIDNISRYIEEHNKNNNFIVTTCDIPLISSEIVNQVVEKGLELNSNLIYPLVKEEKIKSVYAETNRTFVRLAEGVFCGGNVMFLNPGLFMRNKGLARQFFDKRKDILFMARKLGAGFLLSFIFKKAGLESVKKKMAAVLGDSNISELVCDYPEICIDLDKPSDYRLIKAIVEKKKHLNHS